MTHIVLPKCAVLLAVYNGIRYIKEQIDSLLSQSNVLVTIYVSIDRSTDGCDTWLYHLAQLEPRLILLPYGERYGCAAKNFYRLLRDVDLLAFDYVAFSDQDDIWYSNKLENAVRLMSQSNCDAYSSNVTAFWPDGRQLLINKSQVQKTWDFLFEAAGPGCTYVMSQVFVMSLKKNLSENWEIVQKIIHHDMYTYAFARANGYQWYIDSNSSMLYRQHGKNEIGVNKGFRAYMSRYIKLRKGAFFVQSMLIANVVGLGQNVFVKRWSVLTRKNFLFLSAYAFQCRRRFRDQLFFLLVCIILFIRGLKKNN